MPAKSEAREVESTLTNIRCPIHGRIDLSDVWGRQNVIKKLVVSPSFQRLRRIKQLGFVSWEYAGADHSRYSHAIGTMHVMRQILENTKSTETFLSSLAAAVQPQGKTDVNAMARARQHLLVAALLQDCGELPYGQATAKLFRADPEVFTMIQESTGQDVSEWTNTKAVFTLACLAEFRSILKDYDIPLLAYLMTGKEWGAGEERVELRAVLHLLDGVYDADRLDYAARDAHHTGVGRIDIKEAVSALIDVDADGPVCSSPGTVGSLLALRSHLYSTVYTSAPNRFRVMLLREALGSAFTSDATGKIKKNIDVQPTLTVDSFLQLDDVAIEGFITDARSVKSSFPKKGQIALALLNGESDGYQERWLSTRQSIASKSNLDIPMAVFAEFYEDATSATQKNVRIGTSQSIRAAKPSSDGGVYDLPQLHDFNGPYSQVLNHSGSTLPTNGDVLVFEPGEELLSPDYREARDNRTLAAAIRDALKQSATLIREDTRTLPGYTGPAIFLSWCTDDKALAAAVANELHRRNRRYFMIWRDYTGLGTAPGDNSVQAVQDADAAIVLASPAYARRFQDSSSGNIGREVVKMGHRLSESGGKFPIVTLAGAPFEELNDFPWYPLLSQTEASWTGPAVRPNAVGAVSEAVDAALDVIDRRFRPSEAD
jgi:HD superfamily phosphohydrolase